MAKKPTYEELEQRVLELEGAEFERKTPVDARRESEERQESIIHKIQAAVVVHDADTRIIACNSKAQELLGLTEDQMLGKTVIDPDWKFLNADGERMSLEEYPVNQLMATRQPLRDFTTGIYRPKKRDQVWVLVKADPVSDYKGNTQQVIVTFIDITERKRAQDALLEQMHRIEQILQTTMDGYILADTEGELLEVNSAYCQMVGYSREELLKMNIRELEVKLSSDQVEQRIERMVREGGARFETNHKCKNGRIIEVTAEHELVWEYISPYWGTLFKMNMVYRAYRFPYEWIPQVDPPKEIPIEPVDVTSFRMPGASPKGPRSEVTVEDTVPFQTSSALCVISDTDGDE